MIELISLFWIRKIFAKYMSNYMKIKNNFSGLQRKSSLDVEQVSEIARVNDIEFEIVHNPSSAGNHHLNDSNDQNNRQTSFQQDKKDYDRTSFNESKSMVGGTNKSTATHTLSKQNSSNLSNEFQNSGRNESILITNDERSSEGKGKGGRPSN